MPFADLPFYRYVYCNLLIYNEFSPPPQGEVAGLAVTIHHRQNTVRNLIHQRSRCHYLGDKNIFFFLARKNIFFINTD